jgi:hypothetical protein
MKDRKTPLHVPLQRALFVGLACFLVAVGTLLFQIASANSEAKTLQSRTADITKQAEALQADVERAKKLAVSEEPGKLNPISELQLRIREVAVINKVTLVEFRTSTESVPYLTRFSKDAGESNWNQIECQVSLKGSVRAVMDVMASSGDQEVPFEYNGVELSRDEVDESGVAKVIAKFSFRVLTRGAK